MTKTITEHRNGILERAIVEERESAVHHMRLHLEELGKREKLNREEIVHHVKLLLSELGRMG